MSQITVKSCIDYRWILAQSPVTICLKWTGDVICLHGTGGLFTGGKDRQNANAYL